MRAPVDVEARGRVRAFKQSLAAEFRRKDALFHRPQTGHQAERYALCSSSTGRRRALSKLTAAFGPVCFTCGPYAVWTVLRPRESVIRTPRDAGQAQDAVVVDFVVAGPSRDGCYLQAGLWTLEIPDHALHRLVQRYRTADIRAVILNAHQNLLLAARLPEPEENVHLPAGPGAFAGQMVYGVTENSERMVYFRPRTWLHEVMLDGSEETLVPGDRALGNGILLPSPLRHIDIVRSVA